MADTLTNIQSDVRRYAFDNSIDITTGDGLRVFNEVYQGLFSPKYKLYGVVLGRRWPEATQEDTSITLTAGTGQYTWPTSPTFKPQPFLEYLDVSSNDDPVPIDWATTLAEWSPADLSTNGLPVLARLINVSGTLKLELRPKPDTTGDKIRITGEIEVTELTQGSDTTIFANKNIDRALAQIVAARFKSYRGDRGRAIELVTEAEGLLPIYEYTPQLRGTGVVTPWWT
jgi:hypothetical protein